MTPDFSKLTENDKALLDNVINKINIGGDAAGSSIRYIGPDAEKTLVYRDENGEIIRKLEPEGQETPVVVASIEGAASTLGKLEVEDDNLHTDVLETKGLLVNINSIEPNNKAVYTHAVGDFIIYNNDTTPVCAKVTRQIRIDDLIISSGSNANVQNETLTDEIKAMKAAFQAGVDAVYQACATEGVTPSASTPEAIAQAIALIRSGGNANSAQILSGYSAYSNKTLKNGTMTNQGAWTGTGTPTGNNQVNVAIPAGYHNGSGYITCKGQTAYSAGVTAADARANPASANYQAGVAAADARANPASANYQAGVAAADARANPASANYQAGYRAAVSLAQAHDRNVYTLIVRARENFIAAAAAKDWSNAKSSDKAMYNHYVDLHNALSAM